MAQALLQRLVKTPGQWARTFFDFWYAPIDDRIYALLRIGLAIGAFANFIQIFPDRYTLMSESGIFDSSNVPHAKYYPSIFRVLNSDLSVDLLMLGALLATIAIGLGWFSRAAIAYYYFWQLSFSHIAFPSLSGYDAILRSVAFILLISPTGESISLSGWLKFKKHGTPLPVESPCYGIMLTRIQVSIIYIVACFAKIPDQYWQSGEHWMYFALSTYSNWIPVSVVHLQNLSAFLTFSAIAVEYCMPFLLWSTRWHRLAFALGILLHFGIIAVAPKITLFSIVICSTYFAFFDTKDVDWLLGFTARIRGRVSLLL